jgi:hypothetical protein
LRADDLPVNFAIAVDYIGFGIHGGAVRKRRLLGRVAIGGIVDMVGFEEIEIGVLIIVEANAQDGTAERCDTLLQLDKGRGLVDTGRALPRKSESCSTFPARVKSKFLAGRPRKLASPCR